MKIIKRNGEKVDFDDIKIYYAIDQANEDVRSTFPNEEHLSERQINNLVDSICEKCESIENLTVENVQDLVEETLMKRDYPVIARSYIRYRYKKELARNQYNEMMDAIEEKLHAVNIQNQNANVDENSFGGRMGEATRVITKKFAIDHLLSPMARANHLNNEIYIHDLDNYAVGNHNCLSIPFDDLLANGFNTRQTDVRPAGSVNTAFQLVAVIFQLQSLQQFGGVSATHIDWTMVPYVRLSFYKHWKEGMLYIEHAEYAELDKNNEVKNMSIEDPYYKKYYGAYQYALDMTKKEVHQAVEGMYHNLNTLQSRSGNQLPFTSVNYGTCTLPEGRMVTKSLLEVSVEGLGKLHRTSIFPCGIFQCMKGVNREPNDPNYDLFQLAIKSTAKRLYPNYANVDWSGNAGYDRTDPRTYFSTINKTVA